MTCVDATVTEFLVYDLLPERHVTCEGLVAEEFVPLAPLSAGQIDSPLEAMRAVDNELYYSPEYYYWDTSTQTSIGCPFGGNVSFEPTDIGESFTFTNCAFMDDFILTGSGSNHYDAGLLTFNVAVTGLKDGTLTYTRGADDVAHVTGEYGGEAVDLSE